jgi:FlaA1/EpsC-like NDP-sugar epimerase
VLLDALIVALSFYTAVVLRFLDGSARDMQLGLAAMAASVGPVVVLFVGANVLWRLDQRVWRYASATEVVPIFVAAMSSTVVVFTVDLAVGRGGARPMPLSVAIVGGFFTFCGMVAVRYRSRLTARVGRPNKQDQPDVIRTVIYGAGEAGQLLAWRMLNQHEGRRYRPLGFIDDNRAKQGLRIHGIPVLGSRSDIRAVVERERVDLIVLALSKSSSENLLEIMSIAQETNVQIKVLPSPFESMTSKKAAPLLREMRAEDLLGRKPASIDVAACEAVLKAKTILVTGGCGSVGSELCRQVAAFGPYRLVVVDNNESGLFDFEIELRATFPEIRLSFVVGDITDQLKMDRVFAETRPQVIFHAAAYKHVPLMEVYPEEAVRVNLGGTRIALDMAERHRAEHFVLVSTDKAVNPGSVMGATKRICELMLMSREPSEARHNGDNGRQPAHLLCTAVRFGNVLGSRGSVVPTFAKQIDLGGPVTVTHPDMTRYFMDVSEAACLIISAAGMTKGRDIFMLEMGERIRVDDLARRMIRMRGLRPEIDIQIAYTGVRPGEKLHEELVRPDDEVSRTSHPMIYQVLPLGANSVSNVAFEVDRLLKLAERGERDELVRELMRVSGDHGSQPGNGELHLPATREGLVSETRDRSSIQSAGG